MDKNTYMLGMKKIFFISLLLVSSLYSSVTNEYPSQKLLKSKTPIIDIRTVGEWIDGGVLKGAIPIMFFDEKGNYDLNAFLKALHSKVDTTKPFALICRSGSRTKMVSNYLSKTYGYNVINLQGGMNFAKSQRLPIVPFK